MKLHRDKNSKQPAVYLARSRRRGLAPLEMILCTPFLLIIMALMVNFATAASWKLRSLTAGRFAAYMTRWPRMCRNSNFTTATWTVFQNATMPQQFPQPYTVDSSHGSDRYLSLPDPSQGHPVISGPTVMSLGVNQNTLDFSAGIWDGVANLERTFPFPAVSTKSTYSYENLRHPIVENQLEYHRMGLDHNERRRSPVIFDIDSNYNPRDFCATTESLISATESDFGPLYQDWELAAYNRAIMADPTSTKPLVQPTSLNFWPGGPSFCSDSTPDITGLQQRIQSLPSRLQTEFNKLYQ